MIERLDHINLRTSRLDEMIAWYGRVLEMRPGNRPAFEFPGAWLYAGDHALVHLVGVAHEPRSDPADLKLEHGAFRGRDFKGFVDRLEASGEAHQIVKLPAFPVVQVNVWDPDGNHLHIDFAAAETG